jgi:hypothetical protein
MSLRSPSFSRVIIDSALLYSLTLLFQTISNMSMLLKSQQFCMSLWLEFFPCSFTPTWNYLKKASSCHCLLFPLPSLLFLNTLKSPRTSGTTEWCVPGTLMCLPKHTELFEKANKVSVLHHLHLRTAHLWPVSLEFTDNTAYNLSLPTSDYFLGVN